MLCELLWLLLVRYFEIFDANNVYRYQIGLCNVVGENMAAVMQFNASNSDQKWSLGRLDAMHVIQQRKLFVSVSCF